MGLSTLSQAYALKVYAGWLGKCIGVRLGTPLEGQDPQALGEVTDYPPLPSDTLFGPEDDTSLALILARSVEDYGPDVTTFQIGKTWQNYLGDQHGTLWWGGYGVSADHTAYCNLSANIQAPESGAAALNGAALAEQVGGQTCNDFWGLLIPDNPRLAASYAECSASVAYDGEGLYGARFVAALVSAAFGEADPRSLVETALSVVPEESTYARTVRVLLEFHAGHLDDWHGAVEALETLMGSQGEDTRLAVVPNGARVALALLYGGGDFSRSVRLAASAGGQAGSNAGNIGMVLGVAAGIENIPLCWREPLNDTLAAASLLGVHNLTDISACADSFCTLGRQIAGEEELPVAPRYHFTYPGATQGFLLRTKGAEASVQQTASSDGGVLGATIHALKSRGRVHLFARTACEPTALSNLSTAMAMTPKLTPGQEIRACCGLSADAISPVKVALYVWDARQGKEHRGKAARLEPGAFTELAYQVPTLDAGAVLSEVGLVVSSPDVNNWEGKLLLDWLDWSGHPSVVYDFSNAASPWGGLSQWTFLRGCWRLEDGACHGSGISLNEAYTGDVAWDNLTLTVRMTPLVGNYHNCAIRVQGALRSYAVGFAPNQQLILYKNADGYRPMARKNFPWEYGTTYEISVTAEGNAFVVQVNGEVLLAWVDHEEPYLYGQIGLSNFCGCHTRYESVKVS